jgi:Cu2+-exporting ATPase
MLEQDRRASLRRLAVAGIGMMQVGMIAIALHAGDLQGIAMQYRDLLRAASAILTAIVVVYSARGFFTSAWNHLRQGGLVMDLPVSLAIGLAFSASLWATVTGSGQVCFDSVTMFTFFLLLGRYFESQGRRRLALLSIDVEDLLPSHVARLSEGNWQITARSQLQLEDLVLVRAGSTLPVDGIIERGSGHVNQASFDGEHLPRAVTEGSLEVRVAVNPTQTRLAALKRCIEGAIDSKPGITRLADWIAGRFVAAILVISALTAAYYWATDPERMLWVCLSVLVVSCPCALALATPAALSAATHSLLRQGVLVRGEYALEALAAVSHFIFDKTGTLTKGNFALVRTISLGDATPARVLELSAGLQAHANHPLATIFHGRSSIKMESCEQILGAGVQGYSQGVCYRIGSLEFCRELWPGMPPPPPGDLHWMGLCSGQSALGWLALSDQLREESASVVIALQNDQLDVALLSGDSSDAVDRVADELGISTRLRSCTPQGKLDYITQLQNSGARVAMVGDGLNDAPVLRGADVSFAVAGATDLARAEADIVISNDSLSPILKAVDTARTCQRVIRQNLGWALAYNISAIPLAAAGLVPPWAAAIGMSASSLLVVANSLRLNRRHKQHPARYLGQANG